ncbi:hypothetical protein ANN_04104 [Periplaneta americana]|uniref:Uncharacterized protein n=1 Tax=Periplaneta americana TaxID=6978 RepID=A0ABQ8T9N1_PERAM|nr:hypothetical protein ANN_04104 [Periplaneta americana]
MERGETGVTGQDGPKLVGGDDDGTLISRELYEMPGKTRPIVIRFTKRRSRDEWLQLFRNEAKMMGAVLGMRQRKSTGTFRQEESQQTTATMTTLSIPNDWLASNYTRTHRHPASQVIPMDRSEERGVKGGQTSYRKILDLGLRSEYTNPNSEVGKFLKYMFDIKYVAPCIVGDAFVELRNIAPDHNQLTRFLDYVLENYVSEDAKFSPKLWVHVPTDEIRTTNGAESFHLGTGHETAYHEENNNDDDDDDDDDDKKKDSENDRERYLRSVLGDRHVHKLHKRRKETAVERWRHLCKSVPLSSSSGLCDFSEKKDLAVKDIHKEMLPMYGKYCVSSQDFYNNGCTTSLKSGQGSKRGSISGDSRADKCVTGWRLDPIRQYEGDDMLTI